MNEIHPKTILSYEQTVNWAESCKNAFSIDIYWNQLLNPIYIREHFETVEESMIARFFYYDTSDIDIKLYLKLKWGF